VKSVTASIPAKVLLVDDDEQQLELRAYVLRKAGYSVFTATGPLQALSLAPRIEGLDLAILDYEMPTMNGGQLARQLKAKYPKLIVILYSAAVSIPTRALDMVDAFIPKGENVTALLQYLATVSADATGHRYHREAAAPYENSESPAATR
jgi:CheY-like chemotaxis protein